MESVRHCFDLQAATKLHRSQVWHRSCIEDKERARSCIEGAVITVVVLEDNVGIIVRVLRSRCVGLTSIDLVIIVLVEWDWFSKSIKAVALLLSHLLWCSLLREGSTKFATGAKTFASLSSHGFGKKA